jgi:hypothetical protein
MHFHWQNLNDDKTRPRWGGGKRYGRAWIHWGSGRARTLGWTWTFFDRGASTGISLTAQRQDGTGLAFHVGVWGLFAFWVHLHGGIAQRIAISLLPAKSLDVHTGKQRTDYGDRQINVSWFGGALWWQFWTDPMGGWSSRMSWWRRKVQEGSFHPADFFLGRTSVTDREIAREDVLIPMPERSYKATVVIEDRIWRRPRWPFSWHRHIGADVKMESDPVPFPGKGENSWDCGEDATYSSSFPIPRDRFTDAVSYAIGHVVASSTAARTRHGGRNWRPKEDHRPKSPGPQAKAVG